MIKISILKCMEYIHALFEIFIHPKISGFNTYRLGHMVSVGSAADINLLLSAQCGCLIPPAGSADLSPFESDYLPLETNSPHNCGAIQG